MTGRAPVGLLRFAGDFVVMHACSSDRVVRRVSVHFLKGKIWNLEDEVWKESEEMWWRLDEGMGLMRRSSCFTGRSLAFHATFRDVLSLA